MIIHDLEQYSDEWWAVRCGIPTASSADKILTPGGKESAQWKRYAYGLVAAGVMGNNDEDRIEPTEWMLRGLELEGEVRDWYSFKIGKEVQEIGFITDDEGTRGGSPDGVIAYEGDPERFVEIKCPKASTHVAYLLNGGLPDIYKPQVHFVMALTQRPVTFISWHPSFKPLVVECEVNEYTHQMADAVSAFVQKLADMREKLNV